MVIQSLIYNLIIVEYSDDSIDFPEAARSPGISGLLFRFLLRPAAVIDPRRTAIQLNIPSWPWLRQMWRYAAMAQIVAVLLGLFQCAERLL